MKNKLDVYIPDIPENSSNEEILRHIEQAIPEPPQALKLLLKRFDEYIEQDPRRLEKKRQFRAWCV